MSVEVTAKISRLCTDANIDVLGGNALGMINTHDAVRVGAVGGKTPSENFRPGAATVISDSGNMVNTMAGYLLSAGIGTAYGISTGKDLLILLPLKRLLELARNDERTKLIVTYVEPGGLYEQDAIDMMCETVCPKPLTAYVTGDILAKRDLSLGHAGAVVEGGQTTAEAKMQAFDAYFAVEPFNPNRRYQKSAELAAKLKRGIRITTLHHLPAATATVCRVLDIERDFRPAAPPKLNTPRIGGTLLRVPRLLSPPGASTEGDGHRAERLGGEPRRGDCLGHAGHLLVRASRGTDDGAPGVRHRVYDLRPRPRRRGRERIPRSPGLRQPHGHADSRE